MSLHLYAAFAAAVTILMLIRCPNVALIVVDSLAHGARFAASSRSRARARRWPSGSR